MRVVCATQRHQRYRAPRLCVLVPGPRAVRACELLVFVHPERADVVARRMLWPTPLAKAEKRLFASGKAWWQRWKVTHDLGASINLPIDYRDVVDSLGRSIHTVVVSQTHSDSTPLVLSHGYASGCGIYFAAAAPLAEQWPGPVYILDSPGCGLSDRPPWSKVNADLCSVEEAEDFYVERLEGWRAAMGIDKMVLCGHSLGGYLNVAYAERYAQHVERLVLVSPAGVPQGKPMTPERKAELPILFRAVIGLWESGWGPFTVVRWGPGKWLMSGYVQRRFRDGSWRDSEALTDYFHANVTHGEESWGGCAHATLLRPGAFARSPLCDRLPRLDFATIQQVSFVYGGDGDWMSASHARELQAAAPGRHVPPIEVATVAGAGHNLMVDNPIGFVEALLASGGRDAIVPGGFDGRTFGEEALRMDMSGDLEVGAQPSLRGV